MSLFDDLDAMARAQGQRETAAREASPTVQRRGRHRAPTTPFWTLRPAPRHQRLAATPPADQAGPPAEQPVAPTEHVER